MRLRCDICEVDRIEDDFSAKQIRVPEGFPRYCLRHSVGDQRNYVKTLERRATQNFGVLESIQNAKANKEARSKFKKTLAMGGDDGSDEDELALTRPISRAVEQELEIYEGVDGVYESDDNWIVEDGEEESSSADNENAEQESEASDLDVNSDHHEQTQSQEDETPQTPAHTDKETGRGKRRLTLSEEKDHKRAKIRSLAEKRRQAKATEAQTSKSPNSDKSRRRSRTFVISSSEEDSENSDSDDNEPQFRRLKSASKARPSGGSALRTGRKPTQPDFSDN